jgi:hypothetical protein
MHKTLNYILGAAVALAMTATGAFATQGVINITSLPAVLDQPNATYQLHFSNGNSDVVTYGDPAVIWVKASGVTLDLNGITVHCAGNGILIGPKPNDVTPIVNHVTIKNGAIDGKQQQAFSYFGFVIGVSSTNVTLDHVNFTGTFGYNADYGATDTVSNATIMGMFNPGSQGYLPTLPVTLDSSFQAGWGTYLNLILADNPASPWAGTALFVTVPQTRAGVNTFSNINVLRGNVQLAPGDKGASSITVAPGYSINQ